MTSRASSLASAKIRTGTSPSFTTCRTHPLFVVGAAIVNRTFAGGRAGGGADLRGVGRCSRWAAFGGTARAKPGPPEEPAGFALLTDARPAAVGAAPIEAAGKDPPSENSAEATTATAIRVTCASMSAAKRLQQLEIRDGNREARLHDAHLDLLEQFAEGDPIVESDRSGTNRRCFLTCSRQDLSRGD